MHESVQIRFIQALDDFVDICDIAENVLWPFFFSFSHWKQDHLIYFDYFLFRFFPNLNLTIEIYIL